MAELKVKVGTKVTEDEAKGLDPKMMGVMISDAPQEDDVVGQARYIGLTQCPWCANVGWSNLDTDRYLWYTCGRCGRSFRA
jgi:hypothetical protein